MASAELAQRFHPGDRVRIDSQVATMPALPDYFGIVKEVILNYGDKTIGYNTSLENDPRPDRVWLFLEDQLRPA